MLLSSYTSELCGLVVRLCYAYSYKLGYVRRGLPDKKQLESVLFKVSSMHGQMAAQFIRTCKSLGAIGPGAHMWLLPRVGTHVGLEVIGSGEFSLTHLTLEWADAGMLAAVSTELVRSREPLATPFMITHIWLLPSMLPDMHL